LGLTLQAFAWEFPKIGNDAPRLLRSELRRLEADPVVPDPSANAVVIRSAGLWIAGAIFAGSLIVGGALFLT
jgi:ubiquinone biosynthesis protein